MNYDRDQWTKLRSIAEMHFAAQKFRVSLGNQLRHEPSLAALMAEPEKLEANLSRALVKQIKVTAPKQVLDWQASAGGIGLATLARLLGSLGHPVIATPFHWEGKGEKRELISDPPFLRTLRQIWQYAGHGDPARSRRMRGASVEDVMAAGNPTAKMIVHLMSESAIKQAGRSWTAEDGGHWKHEERPVWRHRLVYEQRRTTTSERLHSTDCVRCGPAGQPAPEGSPWSAAHQHADALRIVGKEILRDLWRAAEVEITPP